MADHDEAERSASASVNSQKSRYPWPDLNLNCGSDAADGADSRKKRRQIEPEVERSADASVESLKSRSPWLVLQQNRGSDAGEEGDDRHGERQMEPGSSRSACGSMDSHKNLSPWPILPQIRRSDAEEVGDSRKDGRQINRQCSSSSSPILIRSEIANNHSKSEFDMARARSLVSSPAELPFRGFMVAHRRLCRFSLEKKSSNSAIAPLEEAIRTISGASPSSNSERWWLKNGLCEHQNKKKMIADSTSLGASSIPKLAFTLPKKSQGERSSPRLIANSTSLGTSSDAKLAFTLPEISQTEISSPRSSLNCGVKDPLEEEGSRWVKRLKVMNYSRPSSFTLARSLHERRHLQKTMFLLPGLEQPPVAAVHPWIRRWTRQDLPGEEGHVFPSLAAMALVGKAISNFRPCKFQRIGSSLVWNTE